jgi:hypothetical protein
MEASGGLLRYGGPTTSRVTSGRQMDIAAWLTGLRLDRYKQAFLENEIDVAVLQN